MTRRPGGNFSPAVPERHSGIATPTGLGHGCRETEPESCMSLSFSKLVFLGAGNMAEAIARGLLSRGVLAAENLAVSDPDPARRDFFQRELGVLAVADNVEAVRGAQGVVLAVKPAQVEALLQQIRDVLDPEALLVSIAAGVSCARIEAAFARPVRVVRVMPNTPALVQRGAAGVSAGAHARPEEVAAVLTLFRAVGVAEAVPEAQLDAVTALSGSGPAYVFYLAEAMLAAAGELGMDPALARTLAVETIEGAAVLLRQTGLPPEELRRRVTSKGGTTAAAIGVFDAAGVAQSLREGLHAACERSRALSQA
jgi:pyrroline-5-carboxylate reductase